MAEQDNMWSTVAQAYRRQVDSAFPEGLAISEWLADAVGAGEDMTVLDVAAGPGHTSAVVADRGASVICSDLAEGMLAVAREVLAGRDRIEFRSLDAMDMDLPDDSVDAIVCRFGMMLMPDQPTVAREFRRVLRPAGAVAYAVWSRAEDNPWAGLIIRAADATGVAFPMPPGPGMWSLADPDANVALMRSAGFDQVDTQDLHLPMRFADFEQYWEMRTSASLTTQHFLDGLTGEQRVAVRDAAARIAADYADADGALTFPSHTLAVRAA